MTTTEAIYEAAAAIKGGASISVVRMALEGEQFEPDRLDTIMRWAKLIAKTTTIKAAVNNSTIG